MMKKIFLFFVLMFICFFSVEASSYVGYPHVKVDTLPNPSIEYSGVIYDVGEKYFVIEQITGGLRNIEVGDNLFGQTLYFNFPDNLCDDLSASITPIIKASPYNGNYGTIYEFNNGSICQVSFVGIKPFYRKNGSDLVNLESFEMVYNSSFCQSSTTCIVTEVFKDLVSYKYISVYGDSTYEWKEIDYYDWYEYEAENTDFYLLFNFTDISSFDIFSSYDFSSFSDFEKVTVTILINILFIGFVGLCIYIILKAINKLVSWLF